MKDTKEIIRKFIDSKKQAAEVLWADDYTDKEQAFNNILNAVRFAPDGFCDKVKVVRRGESIYLVKIKEES